MKKKILICLIFIAIFTISIVPKTFQNDSFYMIKNGEEIYENGIDGKDHFSFHEDLKYISPHWIFDAINHTIYNASEDIFGNGFTGLYILVCIIACITIMLLYLILIKNDIHYITAFVR